MGWFSASIFGGDTPLDEMSRLKADLGVVIAEADDHGYGTPDEWTQAAERAWAVKADRIPDWIRKRVAEDHKTTREGTLVFLAILALSSGAEPPADFAHEVWPLLAERAKAMEDWIQDMQRTAPGRNKAMIELERWSADALRRAAEAMRKALDGRAIEPLSGILGLTALAFGTSLSSEHGLDLIREAGVPDLPHPWAESAVVCYADRRKELARVLPEAMRRALATEPSWSADAIIGVQVAASILIATGAPMPDDVRALAVEAGLDDPWEEDGERRAVIAAYLEAIRSYRPEAPMVIGMVGLGEAVRRKRAKGEGGLINRNTRRR